jgi:hypothetical protein
MKQYLSPQSFAGSTAMGERRTLALLPTMPLQKWLLFYVIAVYLLMCWWLFFLYVQPSFTNENDLRIGADSQTYLNVAGFVGNSKKTNQENAALVTLSGNLLGPVLVAILIQSLWGIALFNTLLFVLSLCAASHLPGVRLGPFFCLLVLDPTLIPALLTLNKEILSLVGVILFVRYVTSERKTLLQLLLLLSVSLLARWEQAAVTGIVLALSSPRSPLKHRPKFVIVTLILIITLAYPVLVRSGIADIANMIAFAGEGSTGPILNDIQASYGFPLVIIPKVMINLFGHLLSPGLFISDFFVQDPTDIQIYFVLPLHCLAMFLVVVVAAMKKKLTLKNPTIYWCAIYQVVTAVSPVLQTRYQYPVYVILCLELSGLSLLTSTSTQHARRFHKRYFRAALTN